MIVPAVSSCVLFAVPVVVKAVVLQLSQRILLASPLVIDGTTTLETHFNFEYVLVRFKVYAPTPDLVIELTAVPI